MNGFGNAVTTGLLIAAVCAVLLSPVACTMHANTLIHDAVVKGVDESEAACRIYNGDPIDRERACRLMRSKQLDRATTKEGSAP
jgi:hypothetical protein